MAKKKKSKLEIALDRKLEIDIKHKISAQQMIYDLQGEIEPKELFQMLGLLWGRRLSFPTENDNKGLVGYKIMLYVLGNWDKIIKESEKHYKKKQEEHAHEVCGTCVDWKSCRHTESWRIRQPCSGEGSPPAKWRLNPKHKNKTKAELRKMIKDSV